MPTTEGVYDADAWFDANYEQFRWDALVELARADATSPFRLALEARKAKERAAVEAAAVSEAQHRDTLLRRRRLRAARAKAGLPRSRLPARPWQGAGFATRAAWEAAGSPVTPQTFDDDLDLTALPMSKRQRIEQKLKRR